MNGIQDAGINNLLTRRLNITDAPGPASTLAPEVMPVLLVKPPQTEDSYLRIERICRAGGQTSGGVGVLSIWQLTNPATSGMIVTVDELILRHHTSGSSVYFALGVGGVGPGTGLFNTVAMDTRWRATNAALQTVAVAEQYTAAAAPTNVIAGRIYQEIYTPFDPCAVLRPGTFFVIFTAATNSDFTANLRWRERQAQPSELV